MYLGAGIRKVKLDNGLDAWTANWSQYIQAAVRNVEEYIEKSHDKRWKIPNKVETLIRSTYRPELDVSEELSPSDASYYQSLIGILWWIVELGHVDVCLEVSMMSSHLALPRKGHMEQVMKIFGYLKKYHNAELVFNPSDTTINEPDFEKKDWTSSEFGHVEGKEELPPNMPEPSGWDSRSFPRLMQTMLPIL